MMSSTEVLSVVMADGVGFEDVTCLFFCETTAFDMIGIVG